MVEVPTPTTLIFLPEITATFVFDDVKTHVDGELVVGGITGIVPTPNVVVMIGNGPRIVNVACAGVDKAKSERASAKIAYACVFLGKCIYSLSSMFSGFLGYWHREIQRTVSHLIVKLIAKCLFRLRVRRNRWRLMAFFGVRRGHQCSKCVFMVAADKAWSQPPS